MSEEEKKYKLQPLNETAYNTEDLMAIVQVGWDLSEHRALRPEACIFRYYSPSKSANKVAWRVLDQPALVKVSRYSERGLYDAGAPRYAEQFAPIENGASTSGVHFGLVEPKAQNFVGVNDLHLLLLSSGKAPHELVYQIACRAWCVHHMFARRGWHSTKSKTHFPDRYYLPELQEAVAGLTLRIEPRRTICDPGEVLLPSESLAVKSIAVNHQGVRSKAAELEGAKSRFGSNTRQAKRYKDAAEVAKKDVAVKRGELQKTERDFANLIKKREKRIEVERRIRHDIKGGK